MRPRHAFLRSTSSATRRRRPAKDPISFRHAAFCISTVAGGQAAAESSIIRKYANEVLGTLETVGKGCRRTTYRTRKGTLCTSGEKAQHGTTNPHPCGGVRVHTRGPSSIVLQREAIRRYAALRGPQVVATYADPERSGIQIKKPYRTPLINPWRVKRRREVWMRNGAKRQRDLQVFRCQSLNLARRVCGQTPLAG